MNKLRTGITAAASKPDIARRIQESLYGQGFLRHGCHPGDVAACIARWIDSPKSESIGEMTVKITINKEEILRDIEEIREKAEEVAEVMKSIPWYPPINIPSIWIGDMPQPGTTTVTYTTGDTKE